MAAITTIAIIGVPSVRSLPLIMRITAKNRILLFDNDRDNLSVLHQQLIHINPLVDIEIMPCATDASWEADIILMISSCGTDEEIARKIQTVATGKIVIFIAAGNSDDIFSNPAGDLQQWLPHSKVVQAFNVGDRDRELFLEGDNANALSAVKSIFNSVGFSPVVSLTNILNN